MIFIICVIPKSILHIFLLSSLLIHSDLSVSCTFFPPRMTYSKALILPYRWILWPRYSSCPSFWKIFRCFFQHFILRMLGFPLFISSEFSCSCLHFFLHCLCQMFEFSGICHYILSKSSSFSCWDFHKCRLFHFQLLLITPSPIDYLQSTFLYTKHFHFLYFCFSC